MENELTYEESILLELLSIKHVGKSNAITSRELSLQGWSSRQIRRIVHSLRTKGYAVCSGQEGYYYASDSRELHDTMNFLGSYQKHIQEALDGLRNAQLEMSRQEGNE